MRLLVTGASGFAGSLLIGELQAAGHQVRALARSPARVRDALGRLPSDLNIIQGDVLSGTGLDRALTGIDVAYYLIHSMERGDRGDRTAGQMGPRLSFPVRERVAAERFAEAAVRAGVQRIIYLGGLLPSAGAPSRHLASRLAVERILHEAIPDSIAMRSSIVIGARSRSFRLLVRLIERMPVLALPRWHALRTQPIDERDLIAMLARACDPTIPGGRTLELGGPEVLTYEEILIEIADLLLLRRPVLHLPIGESSISARLAAAVAGEDPELIVPLMEGLGHDLLPTIPTDLVAAQLDVTLHGFASAIEHALGDWERAEALAAR